MIVNIVEKEEIVQEIKTETVEKFFLIERSVEIHKLFSIYYTLSICNTNMPRYAYI